jgi:6-pyruvoyltetrahydropterin/6-carboxytetrahydropterin synthase
MKAYLTRRYMFSASHRLHSERFSAAENQRVYGKCNNPHGHGHNYAVEITVAGQVDAATGMVCNLVDLDSFVEREVLERFGHGHLNALAPFRDVVPTTENLATEIYRIMSQGFTPARVEKIRIEETMLNSFEYAGGREPRP